MQYLIQGYRIIRIFREESWTFMILFQGNMGKMNVWMTTDTAHMCKEKRREV